MRTLVGQAVDAAVEAEARREAVRREKEQQRQAEAEAARDGALKAARELLAEVLCVPVEQVIPWTRFHCFPNAWVRSFEEVVVAVVDGDPAEEVLRLIVDLSNRTVSVGIDTRGRGWRYGSRIQSLENLGREVQQERERGAQVEVDGDG